MDDLTPIDKTGITPGVRRLVAWLRAAGFDTTDSGDGVSNVEIKMECALDLPNVMVGSTPETLLDDARRLVQLLSSELGHEAQADQIQANYDPVSGLAVILLLHLDDEALWGPSAAPSRQDRLRYQIGYLRDWLDHPPLDKMLEAGHARKEIDEAVSEYVAILADLELQLNALEGNP